MGKQKQKNIALDEQEDCVVVKIRGVKIFRITNREDEDFIEFEAFDWEGNPVLTQTFCTTNCVKTLEKK